jgi:hypothetical protein
LQSGALPVYGELLIRPATGHATLLHPFLYVIDSKRALSFGEAHLAQFFPGNDFSLSPINRRNT